MQTDPKEERKPHGTQAGTAVPGPRVRSWLSTRVAMGTRLAAGFLPLGLL